MQPTRPKYRSRRAQAPLTSPQRILLAQIARRAYVRLGAGLGDTSFDDYRRDTAVNACGYTISQARQEHFDDLMIRYKRDAGEVAEAFDRAMGSLTNVQRTLIHRIAETLSGAGLPMTYATAIAQDKWGVTQLQALTTEQMEALSFDLTRATRAHAKKQSPTA